MVIVTVVPNKLERKVRETRLTSTVAKQNISNRRTIYIIVMPLKSRFRKHVYVIKVYILLLRYINVYKSCLAGLCRRNLYWKLHNGTILELPWQIDQYTILAQSLLHLIAKMIRLNKGAPPTSIGFIGLSMSLTSNRVAKDRLFACFAGVIFHTTPYIFKRLY